MKSNVTIIGTVGIPAKYGGFETLVEHLTVYLGSTIDFQVFCSGKTYNKKLKRHNGADLKYINLKANGIQSIPYDIISLFKAAKTSDTILILGVSGCIALPLFRLFYSNKKLIINIDGLEHRRKKWNSYIKRFLKFSEKLAVKYADIIISDNKAIQDYVFSEYNCSSSLIAYGGDHTVPEKLTKEVVEKYNIPKEYAFKVCRIEPENNIHIVLEAFKNSKLPIIVVGNWSKSEYGLKLKKKYSSMSSLILLEPIYDQKILNQLRSNCILYVHGHSAGGTNPSLVEAMCIGLPIIAYDVIYNRHTTKERAIYFHNHIQLSDIINHIDRETLKKQGAVMKEIADSEYTWRNVSQNYLDLIREVRV